MVKKSNRFLLFSIAKLGKLDLYAFLGRFGALNGPSTLEDLESKRGFVANGYPPAEGNNKP